jgi:hypothetical protein
VVAVTKWVAYPLRQPGKPWPGTDTKGGRLDDGRGLLTEDSVNVTINQSDTLSKRKGFVRGLDERFGSVVCGLHTYTDSCGREWLLVADDTGISIRQPFTIPVFQTDDSYPSDSFDDAAGLSQVLWRNTSPYTATGGSLLRVSGARNLPFASSDYLRWFKNAASSSYQVQIEYAFAQSSSENQTVSIAIKGNSDLNSGAYLQADLTYKTGGLYQAKLYSISASRVRSLLGQINVLGSVTNPSGFFTLKYVRALVNNVMQFIPAMEVVPTGGGPQVSEAASLNELQDRDLGQVSAIGCSLDASILVVDGGPA